MSRSSTRRLVEMRILAYGLAAALLGTVAYAQTSTSPGSEPGTMRRPNAEAPASPSRSSSGTSQRGTPSREESGAASRVGGSTTTGASSASPVGAETNVRGRASVGVGIEHRDDVSVRR